MNFQINYKKVVVGVDKVVRWRKIADDYFKTVSKERLILDSKKAGIEVVAIKRKKLKSGRGKWRVQ